MENNEEGLSVDDRVDRSVRRLFGQALVALVLLAGAGCWVYFFGFYQLKPGQAAIVFRLGAYVRTEPAAGWHFHLPTPYESVEIVNVSEISKQDFGAKKEGDEEAGKRAETEATMQTRDNSIVDLGFVVQYRISDAFDSRYQVADLVPTLRDAAQAAVREVVGQMTVDGVLTHQRGEVESEGSRLLQDILDSYQIGVEVMEIELQEVQPPEEVRGAFDDVIAASQDASLIVNQAEGYKNELLPKARGEAAELLELAQGYRDSKIAESSGEAARFTALLSEYQKAPGVTQKRLYLEAMEAILPSVEKIIVEPGAASILPYLPIGPTQRAARP